MKAPEFALWLVIVLNLNSEEIFLLLIHKKEVLHLHVFFRQATANPHIE